MPEVNPDLKKERQKATFRVEDVTHLLFGEEGARKRQLAFERAAQEPAFKIAEKFPTMSRNDVYDKSVHIYTVLAQRAKEYGYDSPERSDERNHFTMAAFIDSVFPFGLHHAMFLPTIESQASPAQRDEILSKAKTLEIIGTYAQTEIGHGTFLRGLETTATFDKSRDQFIIHSPTVTSIKFWPGGLGKTSNHAVVMAKLIIDGKEHGMHVFLCQLRDLHSHQPLPGVELGDINSKFGYENMDNGYLKFTHYRIPRTNMLMKYAQVSADGKYTREDIPQVTYLTMVLVRMLIVLGSGNDLAMAATIATRYSAVRRQTANSEGVEPQILDYQTQQMKLFPAISTAYALVFSGLSLRRIYQNIYLSVQQGDTSRLGEIHSLTSCMKALASETASSNIEICRRACGGHGYSNASGIPKIYQRCVPGVTYEGENTVMYLQCARSLLKFLSKAQAGQQLPAMMSFLIEPSTLPDSVVRAGSFDVDKYVTIYRLNAQRMIVQVAMEMQESMGNSMSAETAWNNNSQALVEAARAFALYLSVLLFADHLKNTPSSPKSAIVMKELCEFYASHNVMENSGYFLQSGVITGQQLNIISSHRRQLLVALRPNAIALVDAYDFPDRMLNSCLGRFDGNVYEALYEYAKNSPLNQQQVHPSFHKYVQPLRKALRSKL